VFASYSAPWFSIQALIPFSAEILSALVPGALARRAALCVWLK